MADMSLAADRALNWNLLGSLAGTEIYEEQLRASDVAAARGAHVVALALARHHAHAREHVARDRCPAGATSSGSTPTGVAPRIADPDDARSARGPVPSEGCSKALGVLSDWNLMEIAPTAECRDERLGRSRASPRVAAARGTDVVDVLIDVVLPDRLALSVVLPSLTPSLGRSDAGWAARVEVWKDPRVVLGGSDAGAHVDLMCHANYPTVVLGEVVRDRGLLSLEEAVQHDDRRAGRARTDCATAAGSPRAASPTSSSSIPPPSRANPRACSTTMPGGGERLTADARGIDRVLVGGRRGRGRR